jgi:hypothetical protein
LIKEFQNHEEFSAHIEKWLKDYKTFSEEVHFIN